MNVKIKILKDTPWDKAGDKLSLSDFRLKYGYLCLKDTTDGEIIQYLKEWSTVPVKIKHHQNNPAEWFEVVEEPEKLTEPPLQFIHEDLYYTKELDGLYHIWPNPSAYALGPSGHKSMGSISTQDALRLINSSKFRKLMLYCTNHVNKKM